MTTQKQYPTELVIYQAPSGAIELRSDSDQETIWASLDQIAGLFGRDKSVISRHIKNIFKDQELNHDGVVAFFATTASDGKTYQVEHFNLDMIISIGYRVNSQIATKFRQRATQTLRQHITEGYTINPARIQHHYDAFLQAVEEVKMIVTHTPIEGDQIIDLIKVFASTWFSLDAYDKNHTPFGEPSPQTIALEATELYTALATFKQELIAKSEATDLFAQEKHHGALEGILGNVFQTSFGAEVYPSIESKAVHLLYFIIKNHPFNDGNKRTAAFSFIWFLTKAGVSFRHKITPEALTAITLLIATSDPKDKQRVIDVVILLLCRHAP